MVVHCASYVGPASILQYAGQLGPAIVGTTSRVIEKCIEADIPLVNFSSAEIYGKSGILQEDGDIRVPPYFNPRIEYALGKLTAESMCINSKDRGLRSATIRPFNVAGPRQSRFGGFVMPTFVQQALQGRPLTVFASGKQKRAFLSVTDLCRFVTDHLTDEAFANPKVYNVGNPGNTTEVYALAERIKDMTGSRVGHHLRRLLQDLRPAVRGGRELREAAGDQERGGARLGPGGHPRRAGRGDHPVLQGQRRHARHECSTLVASSASSSSRRTPMTRSSEPAASWPSPIGRGPRSTASSWRSTV